MRGPALFIAQFLEDTPPFDALPAIASWAATQEFIALQIPTWDRRVFNLDEAAKSKMYCQDYVGALRTHGLEVAELASYLQGQVMGIHPAYAELFQPFYPENLNDRERVSWAQDQLKKFQHQSWIHQEVRLQALSIFHCFYILLLNLYRS